MARRSLAARLLGDVGGDVHLELPELVRVLCHRAVYEQVYRAYPRDSPVYRRLALHPPSVCRGTQRYSGYTEAYRGTPGARGIIKGRHTGHQLLDEHVAVRILAWLLEYRDLPQA